MGQRGRPRYPDVLTPREQDVLALIRAGLTNEQIAERLNIGFETVKSHVAEILSKLGVATREEAAAWQPEAERRWSFGRIVLALAGTTVVAASIAGLALLTWGLSRTDSTTDASPTPATFGGLPDGLVAFASQLDSALATADVSYFDKRFLFQRWDCGGGGGPPGAGENCVPASPGAGGAGIVLGAYGSEADILDAQSLTRYLADWMRDVSADGGSDQYGSGYPRVAAIAKLGPNAIGREYGDDVYGIITTKIAPADSRIYQTPQRSVLVFYAVHMAQGWLFPGLLQSPVLFLDPNDPETQNDFSSWTRWLDVLVPGAATPVYRPVSGWESPRSGRKVAFLDSSSVLWLANADGGGRQQLADSACAELQRATVSWSPLGDRIGVFCPHFEIAPSLEIFSASDGHLLNTLKGVLDYRWSPDGTQIAFQNAVRPGAQPEAWIDDVQSGSNHQLAENALLLDWTSTNRLLLGESPDPTAPNIYTAVWHDPNGTRTTAAPQFDNGTPFWIAFDGKTAVVADTLAPKSGGKSLAVLNLDTGARTPINGELSSASLAADTTRAVAINPYEAANQFFWVDSPDGQKMNVASADLGGGRVSNLGVITGALVDLSWDGLLLYRPPSDTAALVTRDVVTGAETRLSNARTGAIRPPQPNDPRH